VSTGERYPDSELTSHRIAYDVRGGCQVKGDTLATGDAVIALLDVDCDSSGGPGCHKSRGCLV
jgi:hypothetical protein